MRWISFHLSLFSFLSYILLATGDFNLYRLSHPSLSILWMAANGASENMRTEEKKDRV